MTNGDIIFRVKAILDEEELGVTQADVELDNLIDIDRRIEDEIAESVRELLEACPLKYTTDIAFTPNVTAFSDGTGYTPLPLDFLRLSSFKMKGWRKAVHNAIVENSADYERQKYRATRGGCIKPVCAVVMDNGELILEYYTAPYNAPHVVEQSRYIPYPVKDEHGDWNIDARLFDALCWITARNVAITFGSDRVKLLSEKMNEIMKTL